MSQVMEGVRVLELAEYVFGPAACGLLAEWGADVIKVEHPIRGDVYRSVRWMDVPDAAIHPLFEGCNRGKRSIGLDVSAPDGHALLMELAKTADVFVTSMLPSTRQKLRVDVSDLRAANPRIIYARASAYGDEGQGRDLSGFDGTVFWSYSGIAHSLTPAEFDVPLLLNTGPLGDSVSAMNLAGGISAALFHRAQTGKATEVDVSLLSSACWSASGALNCLTAGGTLARQPLPRSGGMAGNPMVGFYRTSDRRAVCIFVLQPSLHLRSFLEHLGRPDLLQDPKYENIERLFENAEEAAFEFAAVFEKHPLSFWRDRLKTFSGQWAPVQTLEEIVVDEQALANDLMLEVDAEELKPVVGRVRGPVRFDRSSSPTRSAPEAFEHTEALLLDLGVEWDRIAELKAANVIA